MSADEYGSIVLEAGWFIHQGKSIKGVVTSRGAGKVCCSCGVRFELSMVRFENSI